MNAPSVGSQQVTDGKVMEERIPVKFDPDIRFPLEVRNASSRSERDQEDRNNGTCREKSESIYALYLRDIRRIPLLTRQRECELINKFHQGDLTAREVLITANLRLVVKIANNYAGFGMPLLDLISEGNIGLMKAVDRYRAQYGAKLSTYAAWWIKQHIIRALANQCRTIRLPVYLQETLMQIRRIELKLQQRLSRTPGVQEIADQMKLPVNKVAHLLDMARIPTSLDAPFAKERNENLSDKVPDASSLNPFEILNENSHKERLDHAMAKLSPRELRVVTSRFGLQGKSTKTLETLGSELGLSREAVRLIQNNALQKLRRVMERSELLDYFLRRPIHPTRPE